MTVSVVIPWRDRDELLRTLRENAPTFADCHEVLVVNGGGNGRRLRALIEASGWRGGRVISLAGRAEFNRSACVNVGASQAQGGALFVLDADVVVPPDSFSQMTDALASSPCFVVVAKVIETDPSVNPARWNPCSFIRALTTTTELVGANGRRAAVEFSAGCDGTRSGGGLMLLRTADLEAVQGMNSDLRGWGFEDLDLQIRLQLALGLRRCSMGWARHYSHPGTPGAYESYARNTALGQANHERGELNGTMALDLDRWRHRRRRQAPRT